MHIPFLGPILFVGAVALIIFWPAIKKWLPNG